MSILWKKCTSNSTYYKICQDTEYYKALKPPNLNKNHINTKLLTLSTPRVALENGKQNSSIKPIAATRLIKNKTPLYCNLSFGKWHHTFELITESVKQTKNQRATIEYVQKNQHVKSLKINKTKSILIKSKTLNETKQLKSVQSPNRGQNKISPSTERSTNEITKQPNKTIHIEQSTNNLLLSIFLILYKWINTQRAINI